jgi:hypothetical protein
MHEELRRHWGVRAERTEMVARRHGAQQAVFGTGDGWTYELKVSSEVYGGGVAYREGNKR